jgi:Sigma-70, region 4
LFTDRKSGISLNLLNVSGISLQSIPIQQIQVSPDKLRAVFVLCCLEGKLWAVFALCCLEGKSRAEVGLELGLKEGTVRSRLLQARRQLRERLAGRGITLSAVLSAIALAQPANVVAVPTALVADTVEAALRFAANKSAGVEAVTTKAAILAKGVLKSLFLTKLKVAIAVLLAIGATGTGASVFTYVPPGQANGIRADVPEPKNRIAFQREDPAAQDRVAAPLKLCLVAKKDAYLLDRDALRRFQEPRVDLRLELYNSSNKEVRVRLVARKANEAEQALGSSDSFLGLKLHLQGPKANGVGVGTDLPFEVRPTVLILAPGKSCSLPLTGLSYPSEDGRSLSHCYWGEEGDGLDARGEEVRGLHHLSFARNLAAQYEWPVQMWEMNKDFPNPGTGRDALYEVGGAANIGGGYFFLPPAAKSEKDYLGSALFT